MESPTVRLSAIKACPFRYVLAINDTMNVLSGKWKLPIIASMLKEKKRFRDIQRALPQITPRMLSKELRELEANGIIERRVYDTLPVLVEYELTPSAQLLKGVLDKMIEWGQMHRNFIIEGGNQSLTTLARELAA